MKHLFFILSGDYDSFHEWSSSDEFMDGLRDLGITIICSFDHAPADNTMVQYRSDFMCTGDVSQTDEITRYCRESIYKFLKYNKVKPFTLDRVEDQD